MMNGNPLCYLKDKGFEKNQSDRLSNCFFKNWSFELLPKKNWKNSDSFFLYLYNKNFFYPISKIFNDYGHIANEYSPRMLRKDTEGGIGMVLAAYHSKKTVGESILESTIDCYATFDELVTQLNSIESEQDIFDSLYFGMLGDLLVPIEGIWVYLFLTNELGWSSQETLNYANSPKFEQKLRFCKLKKPLDIGIIELYSDVYKSSFDELKT